MLAFILGTGFTTIWSGSYSKSSWECKNSIYVVLTFAQNLTSVIPFSNRQHHHWHHHLWMKNLLKNPEKPSTVFCLNHDSVWLLFGPDLDFDPLEAQSRLNHGLFSSWTWTMVVLTTAVHQLNNFTFQVPSFQTKEDFTASVTEKNAIYLINICTNHS